MANPNIRQLTTLSGNTAVQNATTVFADLVSNAASSNSIYRITMLSASNLDTGSQNVSIDLVRSSASYSLIRGATIPAGSTLVPVTKDSAIYLIEGDKLQTKSSTNANVQIICSYEVLS